MKSRIIKRKQIMAILLGTTLAAAVFVNWYYTNPKNTNTKVESTSVVNLGDAQYVNSSSVSFEESYFETAKLNRTKAHDQAKAHLQEIIDDKTIDNETKIIAQNELIEISNQIKTETDIENSIKSQIKSECVVTLNNDSVEVIISKGILTEELLIKIKDIIITKTSLSAENIIIVEL